eukprot:scaffold3090_cov188-Prasinococcus_capsulatus_cf.AAC.2
MPRAEHDDEDDDYVDDYYDDRRRPARTNRAAVRVPRLTRFLAPAAGGCSFLGSPPIVPGLVLGTD